MERTGMGPVDVVRAYLVTRTAYDLRSLWSDIEALDNQVPALTQTAMLEDVYAMIERSVLWLLRNQPAPMNVAGVLNKLGPQVQAFNTVFDKVVSSEVASYVDARATALMDDGVPKALARRVAMAYRQAAANDLARVAETAKKPVAQVADIYFRVGHRFGLGLLRARARNMAPGTHWQKLAVSAAVEEIFSQQTAITQRVVASSGKGKFDGAKALTAWIEKNSAGVERFDQLSDELQGAESISLAMLTVTNRQLAAMIPPT